MSVDPRTFQLALLSEMRARERVEAAFRLLGATEADARRARQELAAAGFHEPAHLARLYRDALGPPVEVSPAVSPPAASFVGSLTMRFVLPLWPGLSFVVNESPQGHAWGVGFARRSGEPNRPLTTAADLEPWGATRQEIEAALGPGKIEDGWDTMLDLSWMLPPMAGAAPVRHLLRFDFDLLQEVAPV